jgi:hypothetical protein
MVPDPTHFPFDVPTEFGEAPVLVAHHIDAVPSRYIRTAEVVILAGNRWNVVEQVLKGTPGFIAGIPACKQEEADQVQGGCFSRVHRIGFSDPKIRI